jgi:hypothetical protein
MKRLTRFCASTAWALIMGATCFAQHYTQTNRVSNTAGVAPVTDPQLINPWGLSRASGSPWWVSDNGTGFSTLYNGVGAKQSLIVTIPPADPNNKKTPTGTPTGTIANGSQTDFLLAPDDRWMEPKRSCSTRICAALDACGDRGQSHRWIQLHGTDQRFH